MGSLRRYLLETYDLPNMENSPLSADKLRYTAWKETNNLRTKAFGTDIDDFKKTKKNKITLNVLFKMQSMIGSLISATRTMLTSLFGNNILFQKVVRSDDLSDMMTDMFTKTKVNVYVYTGTTVNAFTLPGNGIFAHPFFVKFDEFVSTTYGKIILLPISPMIVIGTFWFTIGSQILYLIEYAARFGADAFTNGNPWKITYQPSTRKVDLNVSDVTMYITAPLMKLLDDDDEVRAVLLHELGHNLNHTYNFMRRIMSLGMISGILYMLTHKDNPITGTIDNMSSPALAYMISMMLVFVPLFLISRPKMLDETYADEFVIKMGYGKALERGLIKLTKFYLPKANLGNKGVMLEQLGLKISKAFAWLFGGYPVERMKKIHEKTEQYDTSANNIDRTSHIKYVPSGETY